MSPGWTWVDSQEKMQEVREILCRASIIAVDTEYDSFRYFREILCLLQIRAGNTTYLFDPLGPLDFAPLGAVFADPGIVKVLHAGDNDIRILRRDYGFEFKNLFDTSRAASILGCRFLSLVALIHQYLGVAFEKQKKLQRSQWENRPLTEEQIEYAAWDTFYLIPLYEKLREALREGGHAEDAEKAFGEIERVVWQEKKLDPRGHTRVPGYYELTADEQQTLKLLYRWRFHKAQEINRAAFMILSDRDLIALVKGTASSVSQRVMEDRLSPDKVNRYGRELLGIISG